MAKRKGIGGHQSPKSQKDEWLSPPEILKALGPFDLDPCAPVNRPWDTAKDHFCILDDGLAQKWKGRIWLNPPYSTKGDWLDKLIEEDGCGISLLFARTETKDFFTKVWSKADGLLFLKDRLTFYHADGTKAKHNSGGPSVLVAYGKEDTEILKTCSLQGVFIDLSHAILKLNPPSQLDFFC